MLLLPAPTDIPRVRARTICAGRKAELKPELRERRHSAVSFCQRTKGRVKMEEEKKSRRLRSCGYTQGQRLRVHSKQSEKPPKKGGVVPSIINRLLENRRGVILDHNQLALLIIISPFIRHWDDLTRVRALLSRDPRLIPRHP